MIKSRIAAACILSTAVFAQGADDLAGAFKEGKLDGRLRAQYFNTDWDDNGVTGKNGSDANGLAVGGSLIYKMGKLYGFSAGTGLYTTQNPGGWTEANDGATATTSKDLFSRDPNTPYGEGYAVLGEAYLQYDRARSKVKGGRILMNNPWITPNDTKMIPIAIEGGEIVSNDLSNTTLQLDYANKIKERGMSYFGNMADTGDTPDKIKQYYTTHYGTGTGGDAPGVTILGLTNKSINNLELQGWGMHWPDLIDQVMAEANYALEAGEVIVSFGGRYLHQFDKGAGDIILPLTNGYKDSDNRVDTHLWALRMVTHYRSAKLLLSASHTDSGADMIAPWRGFPTQGYTRSMTQTDWNADTTSYKAQLDYDCNSLVPGMSTMLSYSYYDRNPDKKPYQSMTDRSFQNGDTRQWNLDILYKLSGSWKGTELKARLMDQQNDTTTKYTADTSNREMRLEANYRF